MCTEFGAGTHSRPTLRVYYISAKRIQHSTIWFNEVLSKTDWRRNVTANSWNLTFWSEKLCFKWLTVDIVTQCCDDTKIAHLVLKEFSLFNSIFTAFCQCDKGRRPYKKSADDSLSQIQHEAVQWWTGFVYFLIVNILPAGKARISVESHFL